MHRVDITVPHVDPDGLQGEAVPFPCGVDDDGRLKTAWAEGQVSAWRGVTGGRIGRERARGDRAGLKAAG